MLDESEPSSRFATKFGGREFLPTLDSLYSGEYKQLKTTVEYRLAIPHQASRMAVERKSELISCLACSLCWMDGRILDGGWVEGMHVCDSEGWLRGGATGELEGSWTEDELDMQDTRTSFMQWQLHACSCGVAGECVPCRNYRKVRSFTAKSRTRTMAMALEAMPAAMVWLGWRMEKGTERTREISTHPIVQYSGGRRIQPPSQSSIHALRGKDNTHPSSREVVE